MKNLFDLPQNLPVPQDDGQCDHLLGARLPQLELKSTSGRVVSLALETQKHTVIFCYPKTGEPIVETPDGWDDFPGARGCTPQSCGFRDLYQQFQAYAVEDVPGVIAYVMNFANAHKNTVKGFRTHPYLWLDLRNTTLE